MRVVLMQNETHHAVPIGLEHIGDTVARPLNISKGCSILSLEIRYLRFPTRKSAYSQPALG